MTISTHVRRLAAAAALTSASIAGAEPFNGPYAGVEAGVLKVERKGSIFTGPVDDSDSSGTAGLVAGYRTSLGDGSPIVIGAEGNAGIATNGGDARYGLAGIGGLRLGDSALLYLRAGYAWLDNSHTGHNGKLDGVALGGGAEYAFGKNLSARVDYRHLNLDDFDFPDNSVSFKGHEITAALLYSF